MPRLLALFLAAACPAAAHDVITTKITWTREISRIFAKRCIGCHQQGGTGPMALETYEAVRPWAVAIKEEVLERRMPPWGAVKGFGDFKNDHGLTQEEISRIADWVEGGAPDGDAVYLPGNLRQAEPDAKPAKAKSLAVLGDAVLKRPVSLLAIQPRQLREGASPKVYAELPDGSVEPLLWMLPYRPKYSRVYEFADRIKLPAGTKIVVTQPGAVFNLLQ